MAAEAAEAAAEAEATKPAASREGRWVGWGGVAHSSVFFSVACSVSRWKNGVVAEGAAILVAAQVTTADVRVERCASWWDDARCAAACEAVRTCRVTTVPRAAGAISDQRDPVRREDRAARRRRPSIGTCAQFACPSLCEAPSFHRGCAMAASLLVRTDGRWGNAAKPST